MSKKTIIIIGVLLVLSFGVYTVLLKDKVKAPAEGLTSSGSATQNKNKKVGAEMLAALSTLENLNLDTAFFENKLFRQLRNFNKPVPTQSVGRTNPFAPIGTANIPTSKATTTGSVR